MRKKMDSYNERPNSYKEVGTRTQIYNQNAPAVLQIFGFFAIFGVIGGIIYAIVTSMQSVANGVAEHTSTPAIDSLWASVGWAIFMFGGVAGFILLVFLIIMIAPFAVKMIYKMQEMKDEAQFNRQQLYDQAQALKQIEQQNQPLLLEDKQYGIRGELKIIDTTVDDYEEEAVYR